MRVESIGMRMLALATLVLVAGPRLQGEDLNAALDLAIQRETSGLAPDSLHFPEPKDALTPPPWIAAAEKDFVAAWWKWASVMKPPADEQKTAPLKRDDLINAAKDSEPFADLIRRCLNSDPPPTLDEFRRFTYETLSWCGNTGDGFRNMEDKGMILTLLRLREYPAALRRLAQRRIPATDSLLRAFGVDPEEFRIGAWLNKQDMPDELCKTGGERSARMLMDWVDLRWDVELERWKLASATHCYESYPEPYFPGRDIIQLLRPDNGVTEETKARIAKFIETRGREMFPTKSWLYGYPKGAEKWLVPVARIGLGDELNEIRKRSSHLLTAAGVAHSEPEMRPAPRFRVTIDGNPWPGKYGRPERDRPCAPPMELATKEAQFSAYLTPVGTDLYEADPDKFRENGPPIKASIDMTPREYDGKPIDPASLWLHADVPLPISFDKVNEIHIKSQKFWIAPRFSRPAAADEDDGYEVEFHRAQGTKDEPVPREGHCRLFVKGRDPLALSNVSPGEYWLRIYHPGSVLSEWKKVTVSWWLNTVRLQLDVGSCLVVPVDWPEMESPEELPPELAREFVWSSSSANEKLRSVIRLKRQDGSIVNGFGRMPVTAKDRFPNAVVFPYLPPGEYEVESPDRTIEPKGTSPGSVIRRSSLKVSIRKDSPVFVITGPLKVHYSRKD